MKRFVHAWVIWTLVWACLLGAGLVLSEGEPVCEGPLILGVGDSMPPSCEDPIDGLREVAPQLYLVGFTVAMVMAGLWTLSQRRLTSPATER